MMAGGLLILLKGGEAYACADNISYRNFHNYDYG